MAISNLGDIFLGGLGSAAEAAGRKEQRLALSRQASQQVGENLNNQFINNRVFTQGEAGETKVNLEKLHNEVSTQSYLELMNRNNRGKAYYDADGNEVTGRFVSKPRQITNPDGSKGFILEIETKDGEIKPVTLNRSTDGNDVPAILDQSAYELLAESLFDASVGRNGISGRAVGQWRSDLIQSNAGNQIKQIAAQMITDDQVAPDSLISGLSELNEQLKQIDPSRGSQPTGLQDSSITTTQQPETQDQAAPEVDSAVQEEIISLKNELKSIEKPVRAQARTGKKYTDDARAAEINARLNELGQGASVDTKNLVQQTGAAVPDSEMQSVGDLSEEDQESWGEWWSGLSTTDKALLASNGLLLIPGVGWAAGGAVKGGLATIKFAPKLFTAVKNLAVKSVTKPGPVVKTATRQNRNQPLGDAAKSMGLTDDATQAVNVAGRVFDPKRAGITSTAAGVTMASVNAIRGTGGEQKEQTPVFDQDSVAKVMQIPTDPEGATKWFANPNNQSFLNNLPSEKVEEVKKLLDQYNVKKKADLVKLKQDGVISEANYRSAATIIAWSIVNEQGQKDAQLSQEIYGQFINEAETGNPNVTGDDVRKTNISAGNLALGRQRLAQDIIDDADISKQLVDSFTDASTIDDNGNRIFDGKYDKMLKANMALVQDKIKQGNVLPKELAILDAQIAEKIFARAQESSEGWKDWFLDWFRSSADVNNGSLSTGFESLRVIRRPDNTVDRVVFTILNPSGSRSEAKESMTYRELVRLAGGEAEANYIITRTGG